MEFGSAKLIEPKYNFPIKKNLKRVKIYFIRKGGLFDLLVNKI